MFRYLPKLVMSYVLWVCRKKTAVLTHNPELLTHNQSGFALIPLIVLLLVGIAAGVLLIQNGVNFLPKAQGGADCRLTIPVKNFLGEQVDIIYYNAGGYVCDPDHNAYFYRCDNEGFKPSATPQFNPFCNAIAKGTLSPEHCNGYIAIHADGSTTDCGSNGLVCRTDDGIRGDSGKIMYAQANNSQVLGIATQKTPNYAYCVNTYCRDDKRYTLSGEVVESCKDNQQCLLKKYTGISRNDNPFIDLSNDSVGVTVCSDKKPIGNITECEFRDIDHDRAVFSHCDYVHYAESRSEDLALCRIASRSDSREIYREFKLWCTGAQPAAAAGAMAILSDAPDSPRGNCSQPEIDNCKKGPKSGGCFKNSNGTPTCIFGDKQSCTPETAKTCPTGWGCKIVWGDERCIYPKEITTCDAHESPTSSCTVIYRGGEHISDSKQTCASKPGWNNYCRLLFNKGCKDTTDGVPTCDGEPTPLAQAPAPAAGPGAPAQGAPTRPAGAAATQPASGNPGISSQTCSSTQISSLSCQNGCIIASGGYAQCTYKEGDTNCTSPHSTICSNNAKKYGLETGKCIVIDRLPRCEYKSDAAKCNDDDAKCSGGTSCQFFTKNNIKYSACVSGTAAQSGPGTGAPGSATIPELICGKDINQQDIPCYAIGVFSPEELKTREFQAKLASINYARFTGIMENEAKNVDEQIKTVARKAIADAEAAQQACLNRGKK